MAFEIASKPAWFKSWMLPWQWQYLSERASSLSVFFPAILAFKFLFFKHLLPGPRSLQILDPEGHARQTNTHSHNKGSPANFAIGPDSFQSQYRERERGGREGASVARESSKFAKLTFCQPRFLQLPSPTLYNNYLQLAWLVLENLPA